MTVIARRHGCVGWCCELVIVKVAGFVGTGREEERLGVEKGEVIRREPMAVVMVAVMVALRLRPGMWQQCGWWAPLAVSPGRNRSPPPPISSSNILKLRSLSVTWVWAAEAGAAGGFDTSQRQREERVEGRWNEAPPCGGGCALCCSGCVYSVKALRELYYRVHRAKVRTGYVHPERLALREVATRKLRERFPRCESAATSLRARRPPHATRHPPPAAHRPAPQVLLGGVRDRLRYFGINGISNVGQNGGAEHEYSCRGCVDLAVEGGVGEVSGRHRAHASRGHVPEALPLCRATRRVTLVNL
ncbi:hypothetical protein E2C01_037552 [Portunus trituberculatus]|uniref:Uncharacterized protein n=1 Tax=Portunus trituberculatus TaxID=210409 RepID=A0A5B7FE98_PORTR|nr:hypothetical protein [Portunus trituberculatus]